MITHEQLKLRNLTIKLFIAHIDKYMDNFDQSLTLAIRGLKEQLAKQPDIQNKQQEMKLIEQEMKIFVDQLSNLPRLWLNMLEKNKIQNEDNTLTLNNSLVITQIYEYLVQSINQRVIQTRKQTEQNKQPAFDFQQYYCDQSVCNMLSYLFNSFSKYMALCFQSGKGYIIGQTKQVEELIQKSKIMNTYVMFALLKQLSRSSYNQIKLVFYEYFPCVSQQISNRFCKYTQAHYEIVVLQHNASEGKILSQKQKESIFKQKTSQLINIICQNHMPDLELGLQQLFSIKNQENLNDRQIASLIIEKIIQQNKLIQENKKKFKIVDIADSVSNVYNVFKKSIEGSITAPTKKQIQNDLMMTVKPSATLGGTLGKCLVDIDNYQSANQFLKAFSKTAMIGGSIAVILQQIPILNYFIIAGGLSYSVYRTYNDEIISTLKKMKQVGKASLMAVGSVGSTVTGMIVGQIVIPIPFLGAFIGGVIGGFLGEKGSRQLTAILNNKSFISIIKYLDDSIIQNKRWEYSDKCLQKLGISQKYFIQKLCENEQSKDVLLTGLCFCIVAYYESRKQIQYTQQKLKQKQKQKQAKTLQNEKPVEKVEQVQRSENEEQKDDEFSNNQFDLVAIVQYLTQNNFYILQNLLKLEQTICHLIV